MEISKGLYGKWVSRGFIMGVLTIALGGCTGLYFHTVPIERALDPAGTLLNFGFGEHWQGFYLYGKKIGFSHFRIQEADDFPGAFKITSEAVFRFKALGIEQESLLKEVDYVTPDLRLLRVESEQKLDGKIRRIEGVMVDGGLQLKVEREGKWTESLIVAKVPVYPSLAQYLYPPLKGIKVGQVYAYRIFSPQDLSIMEIKQRVLAFEESDLFDGPAFTIKTHVPGMNPTVWINTRGEMVFEMVGVLITAKEEENSSKRFIYESSLSKTDMVLDYSLVEVDRAIPHPKSLRVLRVRLKGLYDPALIISDERQRATITREEGIPAVEFTVSIQDASTKIPLVLPVSEKAYLHYLRPSSRIESADREIIQRAKAILGGETNSLLAVKKLVHWVSDYVEDALVDSFSALDALHSRRGECQAHAHLYTALGRAAGIPTRVVSGLVYVEAIGFLYHTWAESFVGYWIAVDPAFNQVPVDATHIKLTVGEGFRDLSPLVNVIGRLRATVMGYEP